MLHLQIQVQDPKEILYLHFIRILKGVLFEHFLIVESSPLIFLSNGIMALMTDQCLFFNGNYQVTQSLLS
jgi:hypothetical protein